MLEGRSRLTRAGILVFLLGLGVLLAPWYAWSSGGVQPGHIALALGILFVASRIAPVTLPEGLLALYIIYATTRELLQVIFSGEIAGLLPALHALFGYCIYAFARRVLELDGSQRAFARWLTGSIVFAALGVLIIGTGSLVAGSERAVGTFNNPNQLGYFGVLASGMVFLFWMRGSMSRKLMLAAVIICIYLCILSLSKSAIASVALVPLAYLGIAFHRSTGGFFVWAIIGLVLLYILVEFGVLGNIYISDFAVYNRIVNAAQESDSSLAVRGYTVLSEASWWQVLFGLSSQTVADLRGGYEVHSTYMAPVASYGLIGGGIFLAFLLIFNIRFIRRFGTFAYIGVVMPMMLYGIAHNGGRTPFFWIFLGAVTALGARQAGESRSSSPRSGLEFARP